MKTLAACCEDSVLIYVAVSHILWGDEVMRASFPPVGRQKQFVLTLRQVSPASAAGEQRGGALLLLRRANYLSGKLYSDFPPLRLAWRLTPST